MSNSNLGLNRKISSVVSKNLTDIESDIYKQISEIVAEYGDEVIDESDINSLIKYIIKKIETGENINIDYSLITKFSSNSITKVTTADIFKKFPNLEEIYLPNCIEINPHVFYFGYDSKLKILHLPKLGIIKSYTFCTYDEVPYHHGGYLKYFNLNESLEMVKLQNTTIIEPFGFSHCNLLKIVYLPNVKNIGVQAFEECYNLTTFIIFNENDLVIAEENIFSGTPIGNRTGYIYVPDSVVDSYKSAYGWSIYASQIKPISELPQEYKTLYNIT